MKSSTKAAWSHGGDSRGAIVDELVEEQRRFQTGLERRVGQEEGAEEGQGNAHRADEQVLPGRLQRAGVVVEIDGRRTDQGGRLHRHPHQPEVVRQRDQGHHGQHGEEVGAEDPVGPVGCGEPGSPARRASRERTGRSGSRGSPCQGGRAAASRPIRRGPSRRLTRRSQQRPARGVPTLPGEAATAASGSTGRRTSPLPSPGGTGSASRPSVIPSTPSGAPC